MSKPTPDKPRLVEVTDPDEIAAIIAGQGGCLNRPFGFKWRDGKWYAEADSLRDWRERGRP